MKQICKKKFYSEHLFKYNVFYVAVKVTIKNYRSLNRNAFLYNTMKSLLNKLCAKF